MACTTGHCTVANKCQVCGWALSLDACCVVVARRAGFSIAVAVEPAHLQAHAQLFGGGLHLLDGKMLPWTTACCSRWLLLFCTCPVCGALSRLFSSFILQPSGLQRAWTDTPLCYRRRSPTMAACWSQQHWTVWDACLTQTADMWSGPGRCDPADAVGTALRPLLVHVVPNDAASAYCTSRSAVDLRRIQLWRGWLMAIALQPLQATACCRCCCG